MSDEKLNRERKPAWALILDAHQKSSLAAIRSLGEKGVLICAGSHGGTAMGLYSRYVTQRFVYPSPLQDRARFVDALSQKVRQLGRCIVLAFSDSTLLPIVDNTPSLSDLFVQLLPSDLRKFRTAFDKGCTVQLAEHLGVEVPRTSLCKSVSELEALGRKLRYPVVLKPCRTVYWKGNSGVQETPRFAFSPEDLKVKSNQLLASTGEMPLLQQYIEGEETGVEFLAENGRPIAACAHRRLRSASPAGGSGVVTQTVPLDYHGTGERAQRLAAALDWSGPMMVEFKICKKTGTPYLMEINGRFWGSLPLARAAGVDFPYLYYRLASGDRVPEQMEYTKSLISRHFWGDFANLRSALLKRDPLRQSAYPSRFGAIRAFLASYGSCSPAVFDSRDWKPSFAEAVDTFRTIVAKRLTAQQAAPLQKA